ncbi:hypothetical protein G7Y89_g12026 [Cudoniella acicularis]|uniref:F-box domain-containing protein n=1 Tax=Cudoniella acicularis TaxID=354080 RepID=A0A8H4R9T1_9HELO|nr:hypothetical protein G7Y89_g12026 [Cudoniella acicularis]
MAKECPNKGDPTDPRNGQQQILVQLVLSLALGISAFFGFCILRPRWKSLYAARKRQSNSAHALPELPDTFFGWMPVLYRVTEEQVLASAGLDAYVVSCNLLQNMPTMEAYRLQFLAFFKMSIKLFGVMFLMTSAILAPINKHFDWLPTFRNPDDPRNTSVLLFQGQYSYEAWRAGVDSMVEAEGDETKLPKTSYLWAYLVFTYFFTGLAIYFMTHETRRVIQVRQDYLGSQSTITDRTIKLSGIPPELRSEEKIQEFLEKLEIGKVESVTICRNWKRLDHLLDKRAYLLRKLEEAWTVHLGRSQTKQIVPRNQSHSGIGPEDQDSGQGEQDNLLGDHITAFEKPRPTTRIWYGVLNLQSKKVDAIDYFEEQLRKMDDIIMAARKKEYTPTPLAFVTMDSIPACQMAVQALLDPQPMQLLAKLAPAPSDIVWQNTYLPRPSRMVRSWTVTIFILVLTIFWLIPVAALAGLLDLCSIRQIWKGLADLLESHDILKALVQTGLPTLIVSLLNVAVPFLYDYLANMQGMISQGDVELSVISKNFFFTFFNVFLVFTAFGTASKFWPVLQDSLKDTTKIAYTLATSVNQLGGFYTNFILLQGIGLLPFRLLEFGSVSLYPIMLLGAKTPRDYAELVEPPVFKYGFYLPSAILIYILCIVYSILPAGYMVLFFGEIYFILGYYTYKYQLLYAMDHPQHATGKAWTMICYRILVGLVVFQLVMAGLMALKLAFTAAALVVPLIPLTIWYSYYFGRTFEPLMLFIALRSIRRESSADVNIADEYIGIHRPPGRSRRASTIDEDRERGLLFVNPSLTVPLEKLWINKPSDSNGDAPEIEREESAREESAASSLSLEAVDTTSSQIFLSRGVADPKFVSTPLGQQEFPALVTSVFESDSTHIMTLGDASSVDKCSTMESSLDESDRRHFGQDKVGAPNLESFVFEDSGALSNPSEIPSTPVTNAALPRAATDPSIGRTASHATRSASIPPPILNHDKAVTIDFQRGRSLEKQSRFANPLERAESRQRRDDAAIEIDARYLGKRVSRSSTFHDNPLDPCAILDDNLLEPCPHDPVCNSVSEVLNTPVSAGSIANSISRTNSSVLDSSRQALIAPSIPALTTVFSDCRPLYPAPSSNPTSLPDINHLEYLAIKSSSRVWLGSQTVPPKGQTISKPPPSLASLLPTETIHQIYENLGPADFNAARHTCRSWFINSLEPTILETMLRRGGFSGGIMQDLTANHVLDANIKVNKEWLMSKRIARECALGPDWTGNGLTDFSSSTDEKPAAFVQTVTIDFTEVAVHSLGTDSAGTIFTVSNCGRFLMAANGCLVYIYELNRTSSLAEEADKVHPGSLRPITSIISPRRVLACSMDTSSHRYAVALLLDGRMGLVCDISMLNQTDSGGSKRNGKQAHRGMGSSSQTRNYQGTSFLDRVSLNSSVSNLGSAGPPTEPPYVFPGIAAAGSTFAPVDDLGWEDVFSGDVPQSTQTAGPSSRHSSLPKANALKPDSRLHSILPALSAAAIGGVSMPIEAGPRSLYRNLCSEDDPPRSVAICPQRRCVAFGCSSGIELHWVDALTGQDLNRWFPLTAPSDYLFFLPPRRSVDSAKKLRLISSAARPNERTAIGARVFGSRARTSPFWERFGRTSSLVEQSGAPQRQGILAGLRGGEPSSRSLGGRIEYSDHYRAVPLSDGYHILFTDPATGLLCLGSDAPVGGPTKLLRKIWFQGPHGMGSPVAYAGGSDLRWGVRVAAAFGIGKEQSVWLFSVPCDIFTADQGRNLSGGPVWHSASSNAKSQNTEWLDWRPDDALKEWLKQHNTGDPLPGIHPRSVWPVKIRGQEIGKCKGVVDLAVDSGPRMIIWAFNQTGIAKVWQIDEGKFEGTKSRLVVRDGTIREIDHDGNTEMIDAPISPPEVLEPPFFPVLEDSYDGSGPCTYITASTSSVFPMRSARRHHVEWNEQSVRYDFDGELGSDVDLDVDGDTDVVMDDAFDDDIFGTGNGSVIDDWEVDGLDGDVDSNSRRSGSGSDGFEHVAATCAGTRGEIWYEPSQWSQVGNSVARLVEGVAGIARIDVEISDDFKILIV